MPFRDLFWMAAGMAMVSAAVEVGIWVNSQIIQGRTTELSPHAVWSVPLVDLVLFTAVGSLGWAVGRVFNGRMDRWLAVFPAALGAAGSLAVLVPGLHTFAILTLAIGAAVVISEILTARRSASVGLMRAATLGLGAVFLGATVFGAAVSGESGDERAVTASPAVNSPNVILLILDTVRAASLSVYGYERDTTPRLRERAQEGVVFSYAISTSPWTLPSHASMFTGLYPHELEANWDRPLEEGPPTLAETFLARGFRTGGFVANTGYASAQEGLARGFGHYEDYQPSLGQIVANSAMLRFVADNFGVRYRVGSDEHLNRQSAPGVIDSFLDWVDEDPSAPFFGFMNLYDAHGPYLPPEPYDRRFGEPRADRHISPLHRWHTDPAVGYAPLAESEVEEEIRQYDGALAYLDDQIETLFGELDSRGLLENTIVLITSDHGEEFGEHQIIDEGVQGPNDRRVFGHGNSLFLPSVHVPLLIFAQDRLPAAVRVEAPVSLRDVPATLLDLAGIQNHEIPGASLVGLARRPSDLSQQRSPLLSSVRHATGHPDWFPVSRGDMLSIIEPDVRLIHNGDGVAELYSFPDDLWERDDLASEPDLAPLALRLTEAADSIRETW